jgi:hypothetical protein
MVITRTIIVRERRGPWVPFFSAREMTLVNRHAQPSIIIWENDELRGLGVPVFAGGHKIWRGGRSMRWTSWRSWSVILLTGLACTLETPRAHGQFVSTSRSLGGYGAASTSAMASMGSSSPMIPYAGSFGGFMPYRMSSGGGSGLSFSTRGSSVMESPRTSFSLAPMSTGMGTGFAPRTRSVGSFSSQGRRGFGGGGLMGQPMGAGANPSVMPPNFGYPFYQPPSLLSPASSIAGMSM